MRQLWMGLIVLVLLPSCKHPRPIELYEISHFDSLGWTHDVAIDGSNIYIADRQGGISVFDRSQRYKRSSHVLPIHDVISLSPNSGMPVLAAGFDGLIAVSPSGQIAGRYTNRCIFNAVQVRDGLAFAANGPRGLMVARLARGRILPIAELPAEGWAHDLRLSRNHALLADWNHGLRVVDISNPEKPEEIAHLSSPATCISLAVQGSGATCMLALAEGHAGISLAVLDSHGRPSLLGRNFLGLNPKDPVHPESGGWVHGVAWAGRYLIAANWKRGLAVLDCKNPVKPSLVMEAATPGTALAVQAELQSDGSYLIFLADGESGLRMYRFVPGW